MVEGDLNSIIVDYKYGLTYLIEVLENIIQHTSYSPAYVNPYYLEWSEVLLFVES